MPTLVSRNTIRLANTASAVDDYYRGYTIVLSRYNSLTGKQLVQRKEIIKYIGSSKIATIDGIWDADFTPASSDTYKIVPTYPDSRVSTNPALQTLDYITSERYGKGLNALTDLYMPSWTESARICDTQSDVTIAVTVGGFVIGDTYSYVVGGVLLFQGTVKSFVTGYVTLTNVLGKFTNKWNSWKLYKVGEIVYDESRNYRVTVAGAKTIKPVHTSGTLNGLEYISALTGINRISGSGVSTLTPDMSNGNPVRSINAAGGTISGYSLYDADGIDYWRYVGWDEHAQRYVTRHQTNLIIDTSVSIFENINSLLEHFGGILRYTAGQYHLEVESAEGSINAINSEPRNISTEHIFGKIRISDEGIRNSFNSLTIAYPDPANKFEAKNISFFNSEYLKTDRNISKKGNMSIPGITNYYNARLLADKFLIKSRYGLTISFNMMPRGALLLAGRVIQIQHSKYGWTNKKFRITNITHNADTSVDIVAKEYDDSMYAISNISRPPAVALAAESNTRTNIFPGGLTASNISSETESVGGIELNWINGVTSDNTVSTELYSSSHANLVLNVISITSNILTSANPHNLTVGESVISNSDVAGFIYEKKYYVKEVVSTTQFKLSETRDGSVKTFSNYSGTSPLKILAAELIITLPTTINQYIDTVPGRVDQQGTRIERFYWIRHKIETE